MQLAVTGNGIAGLTLALRVALKGHEVTVHDAETALPAETFTAIAPYRDLFLKSGDALDDVITIVAVDTPWQCGVITMPSSGAQAPAIASQLGDAAAAEWSTFLQHAADVWSAIRTGSYTPKRTLPRRLRRDLSATNLRELAESCLPGGVATDYSEAAVVFPYLIQTFGQWQFEGGMQQFETVLRLRCRERGVRFAAHAAPHHALDTGDSFSAVFAAPKRLFGASRTITTQQLGLPFIGMAAEAMADRIGRA